MTKPGFPADYRLFFDTVIRAAGHDITGAMLYQVEIIDRFHDGPDVPSSIGSSPVFDTVGAAIQWAWNAIEAFRDKAEPD